MYSRVFWGVKLPWDGTFRSYLLSLIKALIKSYFINGPGPEARINKILICATLSWTEVSSATQQLSPLRYPLRDSQVPNALEKSAQHSYATQKGLTRFPSHKHEGPQNLSKLQ